MFKILYVVAALSGDQTIESVGRWPSWEQCEAARVEATTGEHKTIVAQSSSCVPAYTAVPMFGGGGGGGGPSQSVSPW